MQWLSQIPTATPSADTWSPSSAPHPLDTIDTARIDAFRERMLAEGQLSQRTVQKILVLPHGILKRARMGELRAAGRTPTSAKRLVHVPRNRRSELEDALSRPSRASRGAAGTPARAR